MVEIKSSDLQTKMSLITYKHVFIKHQRCITEDVINDMYPNNH